ncbi:MAG: D-alanine--D-alanine ligase family protein [Acidimicrobiales bacterium]
MTDTTIAVAFGGNSPEHDVSILTGLQAARELAQHRDGVRCLYWSKTGRWFALPPVLEAAEFVDGVPKGAEELRFTVGDEGGFSVPGRMGRGRALEIGVVVNCCHGGPGEDGTLQAALDLAGIAYTGPTVAGAALGMDKLAFAGIVQAAGLPTLPRRALGAETEDVGFGGPYIVKPRFGGSSIGVEVVADLATARARLTANPHLRRGAVVEPFRPDLFDLNVAVRTWPEPTLSAIERPLRSGSAEILGYADKYVGGEGMASAPRELPAATEDKLAVALRDSATALVDLIELRGVARVDFLSDGDTFAVNEVNTIPGSLARHLFVEPPVPFVTLLLDMVAEAGQRPAARHSAIGADGTVLRSAGAIAAKLS